MFDLNPTTTSVRRKRQQKGEATVEYAITIVFFILVVLTSVLLLVDPSKGVKGSVLPEAFEAVSEKAAKFGIIP